MKWFVTTKGYCHMYITGDKRRGEYAGKFLMNSRTPALFNSEEEAVMCVLENWGDIVECGSYPYVVIECFDGGVYPEAVNFNAERFFWWFGGRYIEINRPHWAKGVCNWAMG